jgi:hypothetical protein
MYKRRTKPGPPTYETGKLITKPEGSIATFAEGILKIMSPREDRR